MPRTEPDASSEDESGTMDKDIEANSQADDNTTHNSLQCHNNNNDKTAIGKDPNLIEWTDPTDPEHPQNWSPTRKWSITVVVGVMSLVCTFASSVFSTSTVATSKEFGVSTEVTTLGTSLFLVGFMVGPLLWGPGTEIFGRKIPMFVGYVVFAIFQIPVGVATNLETIMICRFLAGCGACSPLVVIPGILADMFNAVDRGIAMCVFSASVFVGPALSPFIGGFVTESHLGWRWTAWITLIMAALFGIIGLYIVPETYSPVLLQRRAKRIRLETKNWAIHARLDEIEVDAKDMLVRYLLKPCIMLVQEPILLLTSIYLALIYGLIYLCFTAFPITFQQQRNYNAGIGGLPFLAIAIGTALGNALNAWFITKHYAPIHRRDGKVPPEERLLAIMAGGLILPVGLFWFGWTSSPSISPWPQIIAAVPIGMGIGLVFLQGLNYLIDCYLSVATSAMAACTLLRSAAGAGFPLFGMLLLCCGGGSEIVMSLLTLGEETASAMFHNLGVPWACSLLAFLTLALAPVPFLFYRYGERLRKCVSPIFSGLVSRYTADDFVRTSKYSPY